MSDNKKVIGLLGGVGSGKSTVAGQFVRLGCGLIDADKIARSLLDDETIRRQLVEAFGKDVLGANGRIDRSRLADLVFRSSENVGTINRIIHPPVLFRCRQLISEFKADPRVRAIVVDMPLLLEAGFDRECDILVFVYCDEAVRARRAAARGLHFETDVKKREFFQISLDKKAKIAHYTIDNNSGLSASAEQVARIFTTIDGAIP